MIRWEYDAPYIWGSLEILMAELAVCGVQGWEVIQIEPQCSDGGQRVFLKRAMRPADPPLLASAYFDPRPGAANRVG